MFDKNRHLVRNVYNGKDIPEGIYFLISFHQKSIFSFFRVLKKTALNPHAQVRQKLRMRISIGAVLA
ncbi:hypothetical protein JGUZn3_02330 [Entomobacter blattae]|uniref:Uncharacterized protein n=1 Tax=Entomobacter blattae TaxID=2762277 RepID=A0A7H1NNY1_9PROT|nr:hypothetical protein JGUZn3_02330 [Entomobacter blattae]